MISYRLLYLLGIAPWEGAPVPRLFQRLTDGAEALPIGRALDVGCGSGEDAVDLAKRGWDVTGVDLVPSALARAEQRAEREGVAVQWVAGDLSNLEALGLESGYSFVYDMGCIHGLPDHVRRKVAAGITALAGPDATLVLLAFKAARRLFLPRGMDEDEVRRLFADDWTLVETEPWTGPGVPLPIRRAQPNLYRLTREGR